jgi:cell division activator
VEPALPEHAVKMDGFRDVWMLRGKYVAFVLMGEHFAVRQRLACRSRRSAGPSNATGRRNRLRKVAIETAELSAVLCLPAEVISVFSAYLP